MKKLLRKKLNANILELFLSIFVLSSNYVGVEAKEYQVTGNLTKAAYSSEGIGHQLIGKTAPDFILDSISGGKYQLSNTRGKVVLIEFWHTY